LILPPSRRHGCLPSDLLRDFLALIPEPEEKASELLRDLIANDTRSFRQRFLLVVSRRTETVIGPVHQPETNRLRCTYLAFSILASLRRSASSDSNAEVDAIRVLPASLPISILAFVLGWQAHRGFLSWAVFALFNGILICRGRR